MEQEMTEQQTITSDALYCLAMRLTDAGAKAGYVDPLITGLCKLAGIEFPPQLITGSPAAC
jgi:hypothetical protein